jgi:hypothetical protein
MAVLGSPLQGLEDQKIESALQDVEFSGAGHVVEILPLVVVDCLLLQRWGRAPLWSPPRRYIREARV